MSKELTPLEALGIIAYGKQMENTDVYVVRETQNEAFRIVGDALKALEIIKEKVMPLVSLDNGEVCKGHYRVYDAELYLHNEITQEEYDILKEILL